MEHDVVGALRTLANNAACCRNMGKNLVVEGRRISDPDHLGIISSKAADLLETLLDDAARGEVAPPVPDDGILTPEKAHAFTRGTLETTVQRLDAMTKERDGLRMTLDTVIDVLAHPNRGHGAIAMKELEVMAQIRGAMDLVTRVVKLRGAADLLAVALRPRF